MHCRYSVIGVFFFVLVGVWAFFAWSSFFPKPTSSNVLLVTAIPPNPCKTDYGDHYNLLSIKNKQDYANIHGYIVFVGSEQIDPSLDGAWNKAALMKRLMETTNYEWYVWVDIDALVVNQEFALPLNKYHGRDFILWGQEAQIFDKGDPHSGLNSGVFLLRKSEWSKQFIDEVCSLGKKDNQEVLQNGLQSTFNMALFDQNAFVFVLKKLGRLRSIPHIVLERSYYLNGNWRELGPEVLSKKNPFIVHFAGCRFCEGGQIPEEDKTLCKANFLPTFDFAHKLALSRLKLG
mmetsp:Transcript_22187/g.36769  ORF Transcript_22187/g.36769 Transcript_22187/m.36769 type:complete len:290 (+) Transcript_22187:212-1081(+)|eukprot:CAMPEP_0184649072 /NCGR_PEP_ID=MMETSP0308-20130426/6334_1 /TAXON_ID=38269 /ORGANISM="Gloeochaete witrockiana, Strain SAG 46.84" /LENGTH=289 /DNA_ID=CAMNT_0027081473 /DNA_START=192 /DNA_END=1061 /DNA_ORIENTATION=-